jgi:hypothetical protein
MACIANATGAEPETDIEITPEMVDAGIRESSRFVLSSTARRTLSRRFTGL